jgi:hypothetical protein
MNSAIRKPGRDLHVHAHSIGGHALYTFDLLSALASAFRKNFLIQIR